MSNDKARAAYGRTERPSFPTDAMTADDRRSMLKSLEAEQAYRRNDGRSYPGWGPQLIAEYERIERMGLLAGVEAFTPKPAAQHAAAERHAERYAPSPRFNDGPAVKATWGNLLAMLAGAAVIITFAVGIYLEFAALAH